MIWSRPKPLAIAPPVRVYSPPGFREIIEVTARNLGLAPPAGWVDRVVAGCKTCDAASTLDYIEREFEHFDLQSLDAAIADRRRDLKRLCQRRRRLAAKLRAF